MKYVVSLLAIVGLLLAGCTNTYHEPNTEIRYYRVTFHKEYSTGVCTRSVR